MKRLCFAVALAVVVVFVAGCASTWPPANTANTANSQTAYPVPASTQTYAMRSDSTSKPPRLSVGTSYSDTQLILPWFLNDLIDFVNYR
jgi:hypothetical protein